jgi:hypothetical protein
MRYAKKKKIPEESRKATSHIYDQHVSAVKKNRRRFRNACAAECQAFPPPKIGRSVILRFLFHAVVSETRFVWGMRGAAPTEEEINAIGETPRLA